MKLLKTKRFIFTGLFIFIIFSFSSLADFRESEKSLKKKFNKIGKAVQIDFVEQNGKKIRYYSPEIIDNTKPSVLFIHGAPGTGENYLKYLKDSMLLAKANLITYDRLGYGYSDFGNAEISIQTHAISALKIIEKHQLQNVILVGWSYGVPIAAKAAYLYPQIKHCVLVAGAISPEDEKYFSFSKIARWKLTKWVVPKAMQVADEEKMAHADELYKMQNDWPQIQCPITYYHGTKDDIVPYANMEFIKTKVPKSKLKAVSIRGKGHFILFSQFEQIQNELLTILNTLS